MTSALRPSEEIHSESNFSQEEWEKAVTCGAGVKLSLAPGSPRAGQVSTLASVRPAGTPPSAQAEGEGTADSDGSVGRYCVIEQGRRRRPDNRSTPTRECKP